MTTEYHDNGEEDNSSFWNKEPRPSYFSGVSKFRRWLIPALTATVILVLIIALGASNTATSNRLWSVEKSVLNMTESVAVAQQLSAEATADIHRLKFSVENNKDQLTSVSEALKQLSTLDALTRTVTALKCSVERLISNSSRIEGCCPLGWNMYQSSCYFFSKVPKRWHAARDWCNEHESHLAILITDEQWDSVTTHSHGTFYWIGLTDERTGNWEWVNQTPYVMNRRRWRPGQPDSWTQHNLGPGDEDCAHLHNDGRLNDMHCSVVMHYICQRHSQHS